MTEPLQDFAALLAQGAYSRQPHWEPPAPQSLEVPGVEILALAGRGGMGAVYQGIQTALNRPVAVKVLPAEAAPDPVTRERFSREAQILAALEHAHILRIIDCGLLAGGGLYLVMEWAPGGDLRARLQAQRPSPQQALDWIQQIAGGLAFAHQAKIVHRDLKPANVLASASGELKLADFGLAKAVGPGFTTELTLTGTTMGTFDYMAPEQTVAGVPITPAADVFSLGVMAYELFTGRLPKGAFTKASTFPGIPRAVDAVLAKALAAEPARRFQNAGDFSTALTRACQKKTLRRVWAAAIAAGLLGLIATFQFNSGPHAPAAKVAAAAWTPLLAEVPLPGDSLAGSWVSTADGTASGNGKSLLRLPVDPGLAYDLQVEFTRTAGAHSVAIIFPTASGPATFELDAWELHLGGLQNIDGLDLRAHGRHFPALVPNGIRQELLLEVRRDQVRATWNRSTTMSWPIASRSLSIHPLWQSSPAPVLAIGTWDNPATFHRVNLRRVAE